VVAQQLLPRQQNQLLKRMIGQKQNLSGNHIWLIQRASFNNY
jgi:hypothetical protein